MCELREDTFSGNKDEDAHDHIDRVLSIVGLFNILGVSKDAVMLRVFPFTLTGSVKRWVDRLAPRTINTWDLLKKAFIQSSSSKDGLAALVNKLDNLRRDMKKLKESVHAIQVRCQICEGPHLDKDCPLNEEVKQVEEVRYGEFGRTTPFNGNNGGKFHAGPPGYYTKIDNRPPYGKRRQSLEELLAKHQEESARSSTEMEVWIKKLQENAEINARNQKASLKNLETKIEQLTKEIRSDKTFNSSSEQIKTATADQETSRLNKLIGVSFISEPESDTPKVLQHQLPPKELNPGSFTLPCTIGKFNFYAMADLGAIINVMHRSIFEHLHLTNLKKTNMLCEMADMSKKAPLGIVKNVLVKIDKFLFLSYFVIIDNTPSETTILGRPSLATIHAEIDVFAGKISLGIDEDRISFDTIRKDHKYTNPSERIFMWEFNLEIDKLADEYELGIGKKGHILDSIWEYCNQVHNKNNEWHNYEFENKECEEIGIEDKDYHPPEVQVETFEVKNVGLEAEFLGRSAKLIGLKFLQLELRLGKIPSRSFRPVKSAKILCQFWASISLGVSLAHDSSWSK
ncbi:reverse transcriptase domain-containing protein [Tanacetum coccineum]